MTTSTVTPIQPTLDTPAVPLLTRSEIKAAQAARRAADDAVTLKVAKAVLKVLPDEHTFESGSKGRNVRRNVVIDGRKAFVNVMIVWSDTVTKKDALHETLWPAMENVAPSGYRFGAHEGDGADFGFWEVEPEDDEDDDEHAVPYVEGDGPDPGKPEGALEYAVFAINTLLYPDASSAEDHDRLLRYANTVKATLIQMIGDLPDHDDDDSEYTPEEAVRMARLLGNY